MEYRKRCKVCGKIWCYTDRDLSNDKANRVAAAFNAIGGIASAVGGNVFQQQYFADRMENDQRKSVDRNQCPNCRSLDSENISVEELEDYKVQESFSKTQVSVNSNATAENLLMRAKLLLEDKEWANANAYCDHVLYMEPQNGTAYLYKLMAELRTSQLDELKNRQEPFDSRVNYQRVMRFADDAVKQSLISSIEYIKTRNNDEIYFNACSRMNTATTRAEFEEASRIFGRIPEHKDAGAMQQKCLEMAARREEELEQEKKEKTVAAIKESPKKAARGFAWFVNLLFSAAMISAEVSTIKDLIVAPTAKLGTAVALLGLATIVSLPGFHKVLFPKRRGIVQRLLRWAVFGAIIGIDILLMAVVFQ